MGGAGDEFLVAFDGVGGGFEMAGSAAELEEGGEGGAGGDFEGLAVESNVHRGIIRVQREGAKGAKAYEDDDMRYVVVVILLLGVGGWAVVSWGGGGS